MQKIRVGIFFGGISPEHQVSLWSAQGILENINRKRFQIVQFWIDTRGTLWGSKNAISAVMHGKLEKLKRVNLSTLASTIDVAFPVLHGKGGEDGSIQGFFETLNIPYVGAEIASSVLCMDKAFFNTLMVNAGIRKPKFTVLDTRAEATLPSIRHLRYPLFVKPATTGSSVGISKILSQKQLMPAVRRAQKYGTKVVVEEAIRGCKEIEISVLGNSLATYRVSLPGRVIPHNAFYDYNDKYLNGKATFELPAKLPAKKVKEIQNTALRAYALAGCKGLARVDFLLDKKLNIFLNEINTMPGFTKISMYPKLWEISGLSYTKLITTLIDLALRAK